MDYQCRACLETSTEYMDLETALNCEKSYLDCFIECTQLKAALEDGLPNILCQFCATKLLEAYNFIKTAHKSDALLRNSIDGRKEFQDNDSFEKMELDNMEILVLQDESKETSDQMEGLLNDDIEKNYSEDDADYLLEPSISDSQWACLECRCLLDGGVSYEGHMNMHRSLRPYKCSQCRETSKVYRCQKALDRHINLRHKKPLEEDLQNEEHEIQKNTGFIALSSCNYCSKVFESSETVDLHQLVFHNPTSNSLCALCGENLTLNFDINDHLCMEHPIEYATLFKDLEETNTNDEDLIEVSKKKDNGALFEENCTKKGLKQQQFLCAFCPRNFKKQKTLNQHERTHNEASEDVIYLCTACNRSYQTATLLEQHRKNAHKEREYNCNICGNAFKLKSQLKSHMKLHLERNIQCPLCEKKYARRFDLNVHLRSHTGEMPYECHLCEKKFAIKVRLTYHLQKHYGIKHICKDCGAEFNSKQKLKTHSFKHTGMPYRCKLCDDHGFTNRDVFKRHLFRVHHATISEEALLEMFQRNTGKSARICEVNVSPK